MRLPARPHVLGVDDGPFEKHRSREVPLVAVVTEGADLVEGVAITRFPVDGEDVTGFLADWIGGLRFRPALQAVVLGGITIAGLAVVDIVALAHRLGVPVVVVNRRPPENPRLAAALRAARLGERVALLERCPAAFALEDRLHVTTAGCDHEMAAAVVRATRRKSGLPEPLRLAHLVAAALVKGESRGRA